MSIQGIGPSNSPAPQGATAASDAKQTQAQKLADARAEANAGRTDGDEAQPVASTINKLA